VELIYALDAVGYVNGGKATLTGLFNTLGDVFDIEVKHFSRTFTDIKKRVKGDRTFFLDKLKQVLVQKLEKADENPSWR